MLENHPMVGRSLSILSDRPEVDPCLCVYSDNLFERRAESRSGVPIQQFEAGSKLNQRNNYHKLPMIRRWYDWRFMANRFWITRPLPT